jgi:tetratricopeptide (TPR) repeat protein
MGTTRRGLGVSTDDAGAIDAIDVFTDRLCGLDLGAEVVLSDAATFADVGALQLGAAMFGLYGQTTEASALAAGHLDRLATLEPALNEREAATLAALRRWDSGEFLAAVELLEVLVSRWPTDLLAIKALEFLYYLLGQQHMGPRFLDQIERIAEPNRDDPDFLAVWSFATELTGHADAAAELAEAALALDPHTPWAQHTLAHVFITHGDPPADLARLAGFLPVWQTSSRVVYCHNAWHLAVAHLDQLDHDGADAVFRDHIWGVVPDSPGEQIDAVSYLWRAEMAGAPVPDATWSDVADHVEARVHECVFPFLSAHHGYALARAGRADALATLRASVRARTDRGDGESTRVWQPVGQAVVEAGIAHGAGDLPAAATLLDPVMSSVTAVGGSDAQVDLFRLAYVTALAGADRHDDARRFWDSMTAFKTPSPLDRHLHAGL